LKKAAPHPPEGSVVSSIKDDAQDMGTCQDVTEHKRAEAALQGPVWGEESVSLLRATLEATADGILVVDGKGSLVTYNRKFVELWGIPHSVLGSADDKQVLNFVRDQLQDPETFDRKVRELQDQADGDSLDVLELNDGRTLERYSRSQQIGGQKVGRVWSFRDVTEGKRAQEALRASESKYRTLVEQASDGIFLVDSEGDLIEVNAKACEMLGYERDGLLRMRVEDIVSLPDPGSTQAHLANLAAGKTVHAEHEMYRKDGTSFLVEISSKRLPNGGFQGIARDITERKQAEEALRNSESKNRALIEVVPDLMVQISKNGTIVDFGLEKGDPLITSPDQFIGKTVYDILPPEVAQRAIQNAEQALESGVMQIFEYQLPVKGSKQDFEARLVVSGQNEVLAIIRNISERKQAQEALTKAKDDLEIRVAERTAELRETNNQLQHELSERLRTQEALRQSEERFRAIFEHAPVMVNSFTEDGRCVLWNAECEKQLGYAKEQVEPPGALLLLGYPEREMRDRLLEALALKDGKFSEYQVRAADGTYRHQTWATFVLPNTDLISIGYDITERKLAEQALNTSEARYRGVVEDQTEIISRYLPDGTFTFVNEAHCRYWQHTREELIGVSFLDLMPAEARPHAEKRLSSFHPDNSILTHEQKVVSDDGLVSWVHWVDRALFDDQGNVIEFQSVGSDVTERELAKQAAEEANRAKSEFLSRMSHELRTPLNAILGFGQLLELEDDPSPAHHESVAYILQGGRHLLGLINEVLDIAQIESGKMSLSLEPVSVSEVLKQCVDLLSPMAIQRDIYLRSGTSLVSTLPNCYVQADYQRLKQVLLNLLANAVKYNREGGSVSLAWETLAEVAEGGQRLLIKVSDTGPGIETDKIGRLFTPFERLGAERSDVEGTGLGLALSRRLVEAMGGTIGVDSVPGQGSTFWVNLPLVDGPVEQLERFNSGDLRSDMLPNLTHTVLYIEDNLSNLRLVEEIMKHDSTTRIIAAMQGRLGLDLAHEHHPDLILLDLHLPDIQGEEVLRLLLEDPTTSSIPVLILSADAIPGQREKLLAAGARDYITKPFNIKAFLKALGEVFARTED
jgi:PAS domain S-box-containing protein